MSSIFCIEIKCVAHYMANKIIVVLTDFHGYKVPQASPEWIDRYFKLKKEGRNNG